MWGARGRHSWWLGLVCCAAVLHAGAAQPTALMGMDMGSDNGTDSTMPINGPSPLAGISSALFVTFAIVGAGYGMRAGGILPATASAGIGGMTGKIILPALLFRGMASLDFGDVNFGLLGAMSLGKFLALVVAVCFALLTGTKTNRMGKAGIYGIAATQSNDLAFGLVLVEALHKEFVPYLFLIAPVQLAILNPIGFILLELGAATQKLDSGQPSKCALVKKIARNLAFNPVIATTVLGLAFGFAFGPPTGVFKQLLDQVGSAFAMCALFSLGLSIYGKTGVLKGRALLQPLFLVLVKSIVLPIFIRLLVPVMAPNAPAGANTFGFIYGALPIAPSVFIFATQYGVHPERLSGTMVLSLIASAPLLYGAVVLLDLKGSSALWEAITETEVSVGYVSVVCAGLLLVALLGLRQTRRAPWTLLACLAMANAALPLLNGHCLRSKMPQSLSSTGPRAFFAAVVFVYMAQRLLVISVAHMLVLIARGRAALAARLVPWYPAAAFFFSAVYAVFWAFVGNPDGGSRMMQCWFRYGQVEAATESVVIVLECAAIMVSLVAVEKAHQRDPLPHDLSQVLFHADSKRSRGFTQWRDNPSADVVEEGMAETPTPRRSGEVEAKAGEDTQRTSVAKSLSISSVDDDAMTESSASVDGSSDVGDKFRLQLILLWELLGQLLSLATGTAFLIGGVEAVREPSIMQIRFIGAIMVYGFGIFMALVVGLHGPVAHHVGALWARAMVAMRKYFFDTEELVPSDDQSLEDNPRVRELLYELRASGLLRTRRYGVRRFKHCLVGHELVTWLVATKRAPTREDAVAVGSSLLQQGYLQHVTQEHSFSDSELFFKVMPLRNCPGDLTSLVGAMKDPSLGLFQDRQYRLRTYKCCAVGDQIVDWLVNTGQADSREEAVRTGRLLVLYGQLQHVAGDVGFEDEAYFYTTGRS